MLKKKKFSKRHEYLREMILWYLLFHPRRHVKTITFDFPR